MPVWSVTNQIVAAGQSASILLARDGMPCRSVLLAKVSGDSGFSAVISITASLDGTTWYTLPFVNLTGTDDDTLTDSVTITQTVTRAIAGLEWVPQNAQLKVTIANTEGTQAVTVALEMALAQEDE